MKYIAALFSLLFGIITFVYIMGYLEMSVGIISPMEIPIVLEGTFEYYDIKTQLIVQDVGIILFIILCFSLFSFFYSLCHRLNKKKKDTKDKDSIKGPFVLYLRSFADDKTTRKWVSLNDVRSEEEVLVDIMSDIAPVYAIGDPKDKKMPLGASRLYVDDASWKAVVSDMMQRASLVVLRLGKTDSFWWEVEMAVKNLPLDKVMFVVPESKTFSNVAMLYKILLSHEVDISGFDITIENKSRGSISSFLYFDKDGRPISTEVKIPFFTRFILSYENILRNALSGFREKYGLKKEKKNIVRFARLMEICLIISISLIGCGRLFNDLVSLKCQMPYEFVEKCVESPEFVGKYSDEINGTNLYLSVMEARKGMIALEDDKYKFLYLLEAEVISSMNSDELAHLTESYKNMLLMAKKYLPEKEYEIYLDVLSEAALYSVMYPDETEKLIQGYKQKIDSMPQWVYDVISEIDMSDDESMFVILDKCTEHIKDYDFVEILKILACQAIHE